MCKRLNAIYAIYETDMSLVAKSLYGLIQKYASRKNWVIKKSHIQSLCSEGEHVFDRAWKELKDNGYLKQTRRRADGRFYYEYELIAPPGCEAEAKAVVPDQEGQEPEKQNTETKTKDFSCSTVPQFFGTDKSPNKYINNNIDDKNTPSIPQRGRKEDRLLVNSLSDLIPDAVKADRKHTRAIARVLKGKARDIQLKAMKLAYDRYNNARTAILFPLRYYKTVLENELNKAVHPVVPTETVTTKKNSFCDFQQRSYDYDALMKQLSVV